MAKDDDRRDELFTMRLSADERTKLDALAQLRGTKAAELVRDAVNALCDAQNAEHVFR